MDGHRGARNDESIAAAHRPDGSHSAQQPAAQWGAQLSALTYTVDSAKSELFAEWRFVVGQPTRLTAHLTHTGDRFRTFEEGKVTLTLTVRDVTVSLSLMRQSGPASFD